MATYDYIGPEGGDWFDPANWSGGIVPGAGDVADIRWTNNPQAPPDGPDATPGIVAGVTINLTESNPNRSPFYSGNVGQTSYGLYDPVFNFVAGQLGTASAPVVFNSATYTVVYSVQFSMSYRDDSIVSFGTLDGSLGVGDLCSLTIASAAGGPGVTINGDITLGQESELYFTSYVTGSSGEVAAAPVTLNGNLTIGGDDSIVGIYSDDLTGSGTINIPLIGVLELVQDPQAASVVEDVAVNFDGTGGMLDASGLKAGYGGTISNFATGDRIEGPSRPGDPLVTSYSDHVLTVTDIATGSRQQFTFAGSYNGSFFQILSNGPRYSLTYGPADTYTGPAGGDWFADANWSAGATPPMTATARVYGSAGAVATSATIVNTELDVSGTFTDAGVGAQRALVDPTFDLVAGQIGTAENATTIYVTANSGAVSDAAITFATLNGDIKVLYGQKLVVGISQQGSAITGGVQVGVDAEADFVAYGPTAFAPTLTRFSADISGTLYLGVDVAASETDLIQFGGGKVIVADADPRGVTESIFFSENEYLGNPGHVLDVTGNAGGYAGRLFDFDHAGDTIVTALVTGPDHHAPVLSISNDVLTIDQGGSGPDAIETFTFRSTDGHGPYTLADFDVTETADAIDIAVAPCFAAGTRIATPRGDKEVELLHCGDDVALQDGSKGRIVWIGHRRATDCDLIRVRAGTLEATGDLLVSDDHALFVDGLLVPAGLLVNGRSIVRETHKVVTLWHVELDRHAILLADGVAAESYLDTGNRAQFTNCPLSYDPVHALRDPCADMVLAGERLEAIRLQILKAELGSELITSM